MNWNVLELDAADSSVLGREFDEMVDALEAELQDSCIDYYITSDPYANEILVLIVSSSDMALIDEILLNNGLTYTIK